MAAAAHRNGNRIGETVSLALRDARFEHGQDISDPEVLARIADDHGLPGAQPDDERQVLQDWEPAVVRKAAVAFHWFPSDSEPTVVRSSGR